MPRKDKPHLRNYALRVDSIEFPDVCAYLDEHFSSKTVSAMVQFFLDHPEIELTLPAQRIVVHSPGRASRSVAPSASVKTQALPTDSVARDNKGQVTTPALSDAVGSVVAAFARRSDLGEDA